MQRKKRTGKWNSIGITPKECFRLQGFINDEIITNNISDTQLYKLAGNGQSINVVTKILNDNFVYESISVDGDYGITIKRRE